MMAAVLLRIPTMAYEPNAVPGLANRIIGKRVRAAAVSYAETARYFRNAVVTGVPVREAIFAVPALQGSEPPRLLVTAGSQGAAVFNRVLPAIVVRLLELVPGLTIVHQAGPRNVDTTLAAYMDSGAEAARWSVSAFLDDMPAQYAAATLVLARSGSTVSELAAAGRPSLLVPFPQAADDHQRRNAEVMLRAGAAAMLLQPEATEERMLAELAAMLRDGQALAAMGARARAIAHPGALQRIAGLVMQIAGKQKG
jgi:UDP-N-acetylglucosamine--N-acetylmuramyl-(pentapeptide) pyrophosphoryl-undecaprenol N-acetylglucosamine transferase